jgi:Bacitracin resistance protein BacA
VPHFLGWPDQGLAFDVAVHVGTLLAVLIYFRKQLAALLRAWFGSVLQRTSSPDNRLAVGDCLHSLHDPLHRADWSAAVYDLPAAARTGHRARIRLKR